MKDSSLPSAIRSAEAALPLERTLVLVASKSGTTVETDSLFRHFRDRIGRPGSFVAITDPGTPLERLGREQGFRAVVANPPDIGGRYSALSMFGLVPAALLGLAPERLLEAGARMARECRREPEDNPGAILGAVLGEAALAGRDKLTLVLDPEIASLGAWIEQLVAESSGKQGRGITPVDGEPTAAASAPGEDRLFVRVRLAGHRRAEVEERLAALAEAGHPVVDLALETRMDLGAEFQRWEVATALACSVLGVNAFDEPNVKEAKDRTRDLLLRHRERGALPEPPELAASPSLRLHGDTALADSLPGSAGVADVVSAHLARVREGDQVAVLAWADRTPELRQELGDLRAGIGSRLGAATTLGFGPRYLHSTGQLHKGGPDRAVFLMITAAESRDVPIPGADHGFATLSLAQALGDFEALRAHGRRVLRCHVAEPVSGVRELREALSAPR